MLSTTQSTASRHSVSLYPASTAMALIDHITDAVAKITPSKLAEQSTSRSGNGHGIVPFDDDNVSF